MIKKFANTDIKKQGERYKKIAHLITNLYKIKTINRKIIYTNDELKKLVMDSEIGEQVIAGLKELKVSQMDLIEYDFIFFDEILGDLFPEY